MAAAAEITPEGAPPRRRLSEASPLHRQRFDAYVVALRAARREAESWWSGLLEAETERVGDAESARINVELRRRAGPVSNPHVIHVIRAGWLDCQTVNQQLPELMRVAPEAFVLLWLYEAQHRALADLVATLHYWPIGLAEDGTWM
jgi:hypothetical protein